MIEALSSLIGHVPYSRLAPVLARLRRGERIRIAILAEGLERADRDRLLDIAKTVGDRATPGFMADMIDALYRRERQRQVEPEVVWSGPRLEGRTEYTPTLVVARRIVDEAASRLLFAGYRITATALERLGVWSARGRGVTVEAIVNRKDLLEHDYQIMVAQGIRVHRAEPSAHDYAKFHIKALIGDGNAALVGSANFTSLGQDSNVELGLYIRGCAAATIDDMLRRYVSSARSTGWIISS